MNPSVSGAAKPRFDVPIRAAVVCGWGDRPGEADGLGFGDQYGWYRGRWFVRLPDVRSFAARCMHHHYAIGPDTGDHAALETLLYKLLRLDRA